MRTYLASLLLAFGLAGTAMADSAVSTSTTTATAPAQVSGPNAKKWQELTGSPLQLGALALAEQTGDALQQASVSPKTKLAAHQGLADLKAQAELKLAPVVAVLDRAHAAKKRNESEQADVIRRMNEHEATRPGPDASEGEVNQFNAGVKVLNDALVRVHDQIRTDNEKFAKDFSAATTEFDNWMNTRANEYVTTGQKILSGEIKDDGLAWRQLRKAATGFEPAADVIDGGSSGMVGSDTVDARNVEKWTPEQRKAEQRKPRVQTPKRKNPPPVVPPPSSSTDTAKSKPSR